MSLAKNAKRAFPLFLVAILILIPFMTSCGGGGQSTPPPPPVTETTAIQVKIGDAAADRLLSFTLTLERLTATMNVGTVELLTTPLTLEITHSAGTMEMLRTLKVPQGTYTRLSFTVSGIKAQAWDPNSNTFQDYASTGQMTAELPLEPAITIGASPGILNMDLNLQNSISFDDSGSMMTVTPNFAVTWSGIGATEEQNAKSGRADNLVGVITSIGLGGFTMSLGNSSSVTVTADMGTTGEPLTSLAMGAIVGLDAETHSDGSLRATRLDFVETGSVVLVEGLVTATVPPTTPPGTGCMGGCDSAVIRVNEVWAPPLQVAPAVGDELTLTGLLSATYTLDSEQLDTWSTGAVSFSNATLGPGARVQALVAPGTGSVVAYEVRLVESTTAGIVQQYDPANSRIFVLGIASDSMMQNVTGLMPKGYLPVSVQAEGKTVFDGFPSGTMQNGMQVRVRGLAFWQAAPGYLPGGPTIVPTQIDYLSTP